MMKIVLPFGMALAMVAVQAQTPNQKTPNGGYTHAPSTQNTSSAQQTLPARNRNMTSARARLSNEVGDLLNATQEARVALESQNKKDAEFHIDHALQQANMIRSTSPNRHFVQLYDELDSYSVLAPIMSQRAAARAGNAPANQQAANNQQSANNQSSDASHIANSTTANNNNTKAPDEAIREVAGQFTSVALDVKGADEHLMAAKQALQAGNYQKADEALRAVQDGVVVTSVEADFPLLRARENLMLARESAQNGNYEEAHAALEGASRALANYAMTSGRHANDARMLKSQIDSYDQSIRQNHNDAVQKIENWWDQTAGWITPANQNGNGTRG